MIEIKEWMRKGARVKLGLRTGELMAFHTSKMDGKEYIHSTLVQIDGVTNPQPCNPADMQPE